ncbi:LamG domain-containing protein [Actinoplanes campanulatus]|nr:LamG domain-containing protein [Actinoplanes capillaceus]
MAVTPADIAVAAPVCVDVAASEMVALTTAAACSRPVVVESSQSELTRVVAQPDGHLRFESAVEPQRARQADGSWKNVDLTLRPVDGSVRPAVSAADVTFSAGGSAPMVTLVRDGKRLSFSWPEALPAPDLSGDSATYREVRPDVDLVVRATHTGFTHVLVVKSAKAATDQLVRELSLEVGGDAEVVRQSDGSLKATAGSAVIAEATPAVMWDSSVPRGMTKVQARAFGAASTAAGSGEGARRAPVQTRVSAAGELRLVPDHALLDAADVTYPVFIDPAWSVVRSRWAYATENGCTNTDTSVARVGLTPNAESPCSGKKFRSFFEFPTTNGKVSLKGKHIESAYVAMNLDHSWSCDSTNTYMYSSSVINATPKASWSLKLSTLLDTTGGHANEGSGCSDSPQQDMPMNFSGATVTSFVQSAATGNWNNLTVAFCACSSNTGTGEGTQDRWKKFFPAQAKLVVDYDSVPGRPNALRVSGIDCLTSGAITIGTLTPTLSAVYPDADSGQTLVGSYEWIEVPAGGMSAVTDTSPTRLTKPANVSATAGGRGTTAPVTAVKNKTYAFRVTARDPDPYLRWSGWGAWCQFKVDTSVPSVTPILVNPAAGPGEAATFRFESTHLDVTKFKYGWTAPTSTVNAGSGTNSSGVAIKTATVTVTVPTYGTNILYVSAVDATLNEGFNSLNVPVIIADPAIARWGLETYPGQSTEQALADTQPAGGNPVLTASGATTWAPDVRLTGGRTATFRDGTHLATSGALVDTTKSFTVAAWVRLEHMPSWDTKVISQAGPDAAGFELGVRRQGSPLTPYWSFVMKDGTAQGSTTRAAMSATPITSADVGQWVHLAGVYNATANTLRVWVNGTMAGELARTVAPWPATGKFLVGTGFGPAAPANWWNGSIADVQVFDRVLLPDDFTGKLASNPTSGGVDQPGILAPIEVGRWEFEIGRPCYREYLADTCDAADGTAFARWLKLSRGTDIGTGQRGNGLQLDMTYFPDGDPDTPDEQSSEWGQSAIKTGLTEPDEDGNQFTQWQDTPVLNTRQSFTVSAWGYITETDRNQTIVAQRGSHEAAFFLKYQPNTRKWLFAVTDQDAGTSVTLHAESREAATPDAWAHLVGVYDAGRRQVRLYVNGEWQATTPVSWTPMASSGPLLVGHNLWRDQLGDEWLGGIDDVFTYQGAMTDPQVLDLYDQQSVETPAI